VLVRLTAVSVRPASRTADPAETRYGDAVDVNRAGDLYAKGWSLRQIGAELGASRTTVSERLRQAGVTMRRGSPLAHAGLISRSAPSVTALWERCELMIMWASSDAPPSERLRHDRRHHSLGLSSLQDRCLARRTEGDRRDTAGCW
jgi:hypothetical protein